MVAQGPKTKGAPTLSKTPRRTRTEVEHLRGQIRELSKENKSLKRQLRHYEKREDLYENNKDVLEEILEEHAAEKALSKKGRPCDSCGKGVYEEYDLMGRIYGTCNVCGDRKRLS